MYRKGLPVGMQATAYQVQSNVGDGVHLGFLEPLLQRQEACPAGDVVDEYDAMRPAVEARRQSPKPLLSGLGVCVSPRKGPRKQTVQSSNAQGLTVSNSVMRYGFPRTASFLTCAWCLNRWKFPDWIRVQEGPRRAYLEVHPDRGRG